MRDPARIPRLMTALEEYWLTVPDQRFGQMIANISELADTWNWEDDVWIEVIKRAVETDTLREIRNIGEEIQRLGPEDSEKITALVDHAEKLTASLVSSNE